MQPDDRKVGQLHPIENARRKLGFTQREVAELSGVSVGTIYQIESGKKRYKINLRTAQLIEEGLDQTGLFSLEELSHLGRTPLTGRPIIDIRTKAPICPKCTFVVPLVDIPEMLSTCCGVKLTA